MTLHLGHTYYRACNSYGQTRRKLAGHIGECKSLLPSGFIFQRDNARAYTKKLTQDWIATNCNKFIGKDEWPPNSPDVNPLDYHGWRVMLEHYETFNPKPKNSDGLTKVLQLIWDRLPQDSINKAILSFTKTSSLCESFRTCFKITCLTTLHTERYKTTVRFGVFLKHRIEYCKSCNI